MLAGLGATILDEGLNYYNYTNLASFTSGLKSLVAIKYISPYGQKFIEQIGTKFIGADSYHKLFNYAITHQIISLSQAIIVIYAANNAPKYYQNHRAIELYPSIYENFNSKVDDNENIDNLLENQMLRVAHFQTNFQQLARVFIIERWFLTIKYHILNLHNFLRDNNISLYYIL